MTGMRSASFAMGNTKFFLAFVCALTSASLASENQTPCNQGNDTICLQGVRDLLRNTQQYWFGDDYATQCPEEEWTSVECKNPAPNYKSIITRMRMSEENETESVEQVPWVHYAVQSGSYMACGSLHTVNTVNHAIDATNTTDIDSWALQAPPHVKWQNESGVLYALLVWDMGLLQPHGMWVNKANDRLHGNTGQAVFPFRGLRNPLPRENPFVFALYKQDYELNASDIFQDIVAMEKMYGYVSIAPLVDKYNLTGPVGASIIAINNDAFSVEDARRRGIINHCPYLETQYAETFVSQEGINQNVLNMTGVTFTMSVNVAYDAPSTTSDSCCQQHMVGKVDVDPRGKKPVPAAYTSAAPRVYIQPTDFTDMLFYAKRSLTLILVDASSVWSASNQIEANLVLHWQVINIHDPNVQTGETTFEYIKPAVPAAAAPRPPLYLFVLCEQENGRKLTAEDVQNYTGGTDCPEPYSGRCRFEMRRFMTDLNLTPVGLSYFRVGPDPECPTPATGVASRARAEATIAIVLALMFVFGSFC